MSHGYRVVQWTPFKKAFDIGLVLGVLAFLVAYVAAATLTQQAGQSFTPIQLLIRALGALAFSLLTLWKSTILNASFPRRIWGPGTWLQTTPAITVRAFDDLKPQGAPR